MIKLEDKCPKCGRHLIVREGRYGEFLGCPRFPTCKFTQSLPDRDLKIYQPPSPYCEKCNHTGLIPFEKNGKVIPNAFLFCECYDEYGSPYPYDLKLKPEDIDYPISYSHYRALCQLHGWKDPGSDYPSEPVEPVPQVSSRINFTSSMRKQEFDLLHQTALKTDFIYKKLTEHLEYKKKRTSKYT